MCRKIRCDENLNSFAIFFGTKQSHKKIGSTPFGEKMAAK